MPSTRKRVKAQGAFRHLDCASGWVSGLESSTAAASAAIRRTIIVIVLSAIVAAARQVQSSSLFSRRHTQQGLWDWCQYSSQHMR
ncbi:hypothetical protein WJX74_008363 [Apatococcus lobatus]|uniref:Uncharacterized protein n=1 Tax=Apatococcus lobatus TaxID=904363 RepID=A0AAW1R323_9CHLO